VVDVVDKKTRSRMMSGIRGKDTQPELIIRKALHREGFRYRLHDKRLPGKPDLVFPKYNAVIFIHGCFWHGHGCHLFKWPKTRKEFWRKKINRNKEVDKRNYKKLKEEGWYILIVWECALKGKTRQPFEKVISRISHWLTYGTRDMEIRGK
jgi:DNA mismatch endonuclease (patch repair protein)